MRKSLVCGVVISILAGCGGSNKGGEAVVVAVAAATMQAAQTIQEKRRKNRGKSYECTHYCTRGQVPCGDECLPYGSICYKAPRRACYGGDPNAPEEPMPRQEDEAHPDSQRDVGIVFSPVY